MLILRKLFQKYNEFYSIPYVKFGKVKIACTLLNLYKRCCCVTDIQILELFVLATLVYY